MLRDDGGRRPADVVYLGRLIILTPTNLLLAVPAAATGLVLSPLFYMLPGIELRRR